MEYSALSVDEDAGNLTELASDVLPNITQRVPISEFGPPYNFGWIQINSQGQQMWVQPSLSGLGRFSAGFNGTPVSFLCDQAPPQ
jgi:hypothetical protein